jgi:DNA-binding LacI/PurR family transcriptional regulator
MKRPTIADVAQRAGVTKAAVSFALNGQPGVSAATRERILAIAAEVGFKPSSAARALSDGKAAAFGLVIDRPARTLGIEPYFMQLLSGIQAELTGNNVTLLFTLAEDQDDEIEMYRTWWAQRKIDGVILVDLQVRDRRVDVLRELGIPAVVVGTPRGSGGLPAVWQDDVAATRIVIGHLAGLGHRRIARIGGFPRYWHSRLRAEAFRDVAAEAGLEAAGVDADYTAEHGAEATRSLLERRERPTAILYDNDVMALAGLGAARRSGLDVPGDLSVVSWDDSALCDLVHPAITAMRRDIAAAGAEAARRLTLAASGAEVADYQEPAPSLMVRESTAGPPESQAARESAARPHAGKTQALARGSEKDPAFVGEIAEDRGQTRADDARQRVGKVRLFAKPVGAERDDGLGDKQSDAVKQREQADLLEPVLVDPVPERPEPVSHVGDDHGGHDGDGLGRQRADVIDAVQHAGPAEVYNSPDGANGAELRQFRYEVAQPFQGIRETRHHDA